MSENFFDWKFRSIVLSAPDDDKSKGGAQGVEPQLTSDMAMRVRHGIPLRPDQLDSSYPLDASAKKIASGAGETK